MTHTPGPWEIRRVGIAKDLPVVTSAEHDVCEMRYNTNGRLRLENNARLIAAAPELLAALKGIVGYYDGDMKASAGTLVDTYLPQARAAIAKAVGDPKAASPEYWLECERRNAIARAEAE